MRGHRRAEQRRREEGVTHRKFQKRSEDPKHSAPPQKARGAAPERRPQPSGRCPLAQPSRLGPIMAARFPLRAVVQLLLWQLCSLLLTATGYFSQRLALLGYCAPTAQSAAVYALLSLHFLVPLIQRQSSQSSPQSSPPPCVDGRAAAAHAGMRWWHWLAIAAADVEANYLLVLAYQYTDITSVCILDAFTVPTVIMLSSMFFGQRYSARQLLAAALCVLGIAVLVAADVVQRGGAATRPHPRGDDVAWVGDLLVLAGAALYGCSNVAQEYLVRRVVGRVEYLAHLGGYGALIAIVQAACLEREAIAAVWQSAWGSSEQRPTELLFSLEAGFVCALCAFYILVATLLERGSSATTMNLSLLTSDFWAVLVGIGLLHARPGWAYAAAFSLTVGGLALYHLASSGPDSRRNSEEPAVAELPEAGGPQEERRIPMPAPVALDDERGGLARQLAQPLVTPGARIE